VSSALSKDGWFAFTVETLNATEVVEQTPEAAAAAAAAKEEQDKYAVR
jgi:hypothetical protein